MDINWIIDFSVQHPTIIYGLIYILAIVEGHIITIIGGFLSRLGYLILPLTALVIILGNLTGDVLLYWVGYKWGEKFIIRWGKYVGLNSESVKKSKEIFNRHHDYILMISKLTNGFGLQVAVLFTAGMTRVPFRRYITYCILGECLWTGMLTAVGYFFGHLYETINNVMSKVFVVVIIIVVFFIFVRINKYIRSKI